MDFGWPFDRVLFRSYIFYVTSVLYKRQTIPIVLKPEYTMTDLSGDIDEKTAFPRMVWKV